jgi:cytochrome b6-f complex iron-sulfur subunit
MALLRSLPGTLKLEYLKNVNLRKKMLKRIKDKDGKNVNEKTGRREFFSRLWAILGLVASAELILFTVSMLKPGKKFQTEKEEASKKIAGNVEDFAVNSVTVDRINKYFLIRIEDGGFLALSLTCSHLGCSVLWEEEKNQFICPCHSSAFDRLGNVINSPAPRALDYYPVSMEAGKVVVDTGQKIKRKKFETNQVTYAI